jgi:putative tryptophan/tyrosine transport system substrate-binding protein
MRKTTVINKNADIAGMVLLGLLLFTWWGCNNKAPVKPFTIGVAGLASSRADILQGFKAGMAELGYVEGKNLKYIYYRRAVENNDQIIDAEFKGFLAQDIDILLTAHNETALRAKKVLAGSGIAVLSAACSNPVEIGLVKDLIHPDWDITGVRVTDTMSKGLEWLMRVVPHAKKIWVPYNQEDEISIMYRDELNNIAPQLGIEFVFYKVSSVEEAVAAIEGLPGDIDAIYGIPSRTLGSKSIEISRAAIRRAIPLGAGLPFDGALITLGDDLYEVGKQAARLAHQIRQGVKPVDIPFETSEAVLTINLETAAKLGINITDDVLAQAKNIIRQDKN